MGFYEKYLLPRLVNLAMKGSEFTKMRAQLIPEARGRVLELGIGSGLNLPHYDRNVKVVGVDPSLELQAYARDIARDTRIDVEFHSESAEMLSFEDNSFDFAVITWTLCSIPDHEAAVREVRRVLKPGGRLIFAEHGLAPEPRVEKWQHRLNPVWRKIGGGCNLNRKPDATLLACGFDFDTLSEGYIKGPKWAAYHYRGVAKLA